LLGFVVAVAAIAFIALLTYRSLQTRSVAAGRVTHTLQVMEQLETILSLAKDAETGQRGFLLTGEEPYLEPFANAKSQLPEGIRATHDLVVSDPVQAQRLENLDQAVKDKLAELDQTISLRRKGDTVGALSVVRSDHGKVLMDRIRSLVTTMSAAERAALGERQDEWQHAEFISSAVTFGGSTLLLLLIGAAAVLTSRDYRARQTQVWLRTGQMAFGQRIQGEQRLERLGEHVLSFLGSFLGAHVAAGASPMCGNSICQDRRFLARWMPALEAFFHYRNIDVSTLKELAARWHPHLSAGLVKRAAHLARADIYESIAELRFYRERLFISTA